MPASIRFEDVSFSIDGGPPILDGFNLSVSPGESIVLLGRSGSGKTTTLKLVNRLREPTAGKVFVGEKTTMEWDPIRLRRHIGYVIQEVGLFPHLTVWENVAVVPSLEGWESDKMAQRVPEMLKLVGLEPSEFATRYPDQLSGGQRQRVGVARALAADPGVLLLDEPFGALDPITRADLRREFRGLQDRLGKTTIFVTHDVAEAFAVADRIGLMNAGRLSALVTPAEFRHVDDPEARLFMGSLS